MKLNLAHVEVKAARVLVGLKGHRPSAFNIKVGKCMKGQPGPHNGGRYDRDFQGRFVACVKQAGAHVKG